MKLDELFIKLDIGDRVKYYFEYGSYRIIQYGKIIDIYESCVFPKRPRYAVKREDIDFIDAGYREEFIKC